MASTISFSGLSASGLDTSSWVDALVSVKQQTITSLEQQKAEKENLLSIVNNIKSYFSSFQTCLQKITDSQYGIASMDLFMQNLALSSNSSIATATATTEAARQSYDVAVDSLATATKATSGYSQFEVKTADLNTTFGTLGGKNGTITVNSQSFNVTTEDTLQNLIDKFKNVGVDAKFDESKGTFTIGMDLNKIDEGATNLKNALKLANNNVSGAVSGSVVYASRNTEFYKLGLNGGDINIEGVKHTITKNGNNYTIQKDGGAAVQMNTLGEFLDYLKSSAVGADDATVDAKGHITIKGATLDKVEGGTNLMDVLNLIESQKRTVSESGALSYIEVRVADLNTKLSALGITGDTTLVAGGTNNTISNDKTLGDIKNILKNAGVDMSVDSRGIITIDTHGNEISGTLLDVLNLDPTKGGTTISSSAHQATLKADGNTKLSELGITTDKKYIAYKSDGTALTTEISNVEGKTVNEFVNALKNSGLDAKFDEKTHQITIKDGYIEGSLADALGMTQLSTSFTENASLNTQLEKLGAIGDSTLTIDGGAAKTYDKNTTLETVFNDIKNAGGKVTFKDGNVTIEGVTLGGSLPSLLGLDATTQGTSVTSGKLTAVTGSTSSGGNTESTVEHNIELSTKLGDITGTTSNYTLKVGDGTSTTYTKDSTLQDIKTQIEGAGGKFTINDDNTISIEGVTMSGTVVGALGFDELATGTKFTTVDAVMISGTSNVATGGTTLGNLGLIASGSTSGARAVRRAPANPNKTLSINGGTAKTYGADSSLDDIFADIVAAGGTASINSEGYIVINGVHLEGTLVDALGLVETSYKTTITSGDLKVTTSTKSTSSSTLYTDTKGDIAWDSTIGSIVGDTNSYDLKVNGTNKTYNTNTKLSDIKNVIQAAGGTMTINDDNTISINGVEISGSLVDKLGFNSDGVHTVVSSNNPIYYTDGKKSADTGTTFEQLGIGTDKRDYAIYKNDGTVVKASSTNGTSSGKTIGDWLRVVNDSLNTANGTRDITYASINNGVISITGGYVTGSLPTELGIGIKETVTGITMEGSSVSYVEYEPLKYIGNIQTGSGIAGGTMVSSGFMAESIQYQDELGNIHAVTETTKLSEVLDTSGNKIGSGSYTFNVGSYTKTFDADSTTLGDIVNYVNNLNMDTTHDTTTSATLVDGKLTIESNVSITGTLLDKLGFEKQDISTVAYEIKGTNKAHYSSVDSTTYTASGFTKATETKTGNVTTASLELPSGFATSLNIVDTSDAISLSSVSSQSSLVNGKKYSISTKEDLIKLAEFSKSWNYYSRNNIVWVLTNDIDMSGVTDFTGVEHLFGTFCGNGHIIKNVTINDNSTDVGLFKASKGTIQDLGLENVNVTHAEVSTGYTTSVGALVGWNEGNIQNCYANNSTVTAGNGVDYAGGLVGYSYGSSKITYSWTNVHVNCASTEAGGFVGAILGSSSTDNPIISKCFSVSNLRTDENAGFCGDLIYYYPKIQDCFSVGINSGVCSSKATYIEYQQANDNSLTKVSSGSLVSLKSKIDALGFDNLNWNVEEKELRVSEVDSFEVGMTYHISTVADLQKLSSYSNTRNTFGLNGIDEGVNFVLDNDIDMSSVSNFVGIANFKGNFYGNGHVIKNLKISESSSGGYVGLFDCMDGTVRDLGLENVTITANNSYGHTPRQMCVGALVGELAFGGKIENCYVSGGTISGNATYIGGLIGKISANNEYHTNLVSDCWANVTVNKTSYSKDKIGAAGGLVGISGGSISNSYSLGDVNSAYGCVGGFIGLATGTISNSFSTGNVKVTNSSSSNTTYTGGFAGALGQTQAMENDNQMFGTTVTMSNNYSTGTVSASKGSVGGFAGTTITSSSGTSASDYTMSNNFSDSGSASKAIGSGSVSGIFAVANSEINSGISGLGFSNLTMTEVVNEHIATTSTTIKDLIGKGGEQGFNFCESGNPMAVSRRIAFAETDTIQTVIDKLKEFGFDEVDLVDGVFRIKDDKKWSFYGSSELVNKLFGGDDRTYGAEGPQVTYQVTQSSVGGYTGNKITYTTTTTGTVGSVTGNKVTYETSGTGTAGSVTGNKVTYETTGTGTAGSVTGDKLTYTTTTGSTGSVTGNQLTYTTTGTGTAGGSGDTTSKTYSGSVLKTVSKGYSTDTKLVDIDSSYKGTKMYVYKQKSSTSGTGTTPVRPGTSGTPGKPGNSVDMDENNLKPANEQVATLLIDSNTTIQDVIDFYSPYLDDKIDNVFKPLNKYSLEDGTITLKFKSGYSNKAFGGSDETTLAFLTTTPTVATTSTKLYELKTSPEIIASIKVTNNGNKYSFDAGSDGTDSPTIQDVLDFLNNTAGCTATFTDGKLTVTGASDLEFEKPTTTSSSGKINLDQVYDMSILFGGSMPTPTTSTTGSTGGGSTGGTTGGTTTTTKTYTGTKATYGGKGATAYASSTKLADINSSFVGKTINIIDKEKFEQGKFGDSSTGSGSTSDDKPLDITVLGQVASMKITRSTTIDDVVSFLNSEVLYVKNASYNSNSGELTVKLADGNSVDMPFIADSSNSDWGGTANFQVPKSPAVEGTTVTDATTLKELGFLRIPNTNNKITVTNNGKTASFTVDETTCIGDIIDNLEAKAGCTASITDGVLTVTGGEDLAFGGNTTVLKKIFGGKIPTPTTSGGSGSTGGGSTGGTTTTHIAIGTTKMSELGITDFTVNGSALSGITSSSTVNDVLSKLKSTYGLSEATISDGKITLSSTTDTTLSGNLIKGLMGQDSVSITPISDTTTTTKTYTGTKVTYGATPATGYTTDTKLSTIKSRWVGKRIYVKSSEYTGSTTGYPGNSVLFQYMDITNTTTIDDVIKFFDKSAGVMKATYDQTSGELKLRLNVDYSVSAPFIQCVGDDQLIGQLATKVYSFGKTGGSSGSPMTASTTLNDLLVMTAAANTITVTNNGTTTSFDVSQSTNLLGIISNLQSVGCTASITDGVLTVTGAEDLAFGGNTTVWKGIFGGSIPTPTTSTTGSTGGGSTGGTTTTHTATGTTKMSELGITDFTVNGSALSGIISSSTVNDVLSKLKSTYGLSEATISDGKITLKSNINTILSGNLIKGLMGQDSVSITPTSGTTTTTKTYTGTKVTIGGSSATGYATDTKLATIYSSWVGMRMYVKSSSYTGSTTGLPNQSYDFTYLDITNSTTIQDVVNFFKHAGGVSSATYDQSTGKLEVRLYDGYTADTPFMHDISLLPDDNGYGGTRRYSIGQTGGSSGSTMTGDTTLQDISCRVLAAKKTLTVTNNGHTTSFDVQTTSTINWILMGLDRAGCTATITDGVLTVTGSEDLEFGGNTAVWEKIFGGSIPTPTTSTTGSTGGGSTGSTITVTATGSTTLGQLGFNFENTSLFVDGNTVYEHKDPTGGFLNQIISEGTTIDKILSALQDQFGITGSITDGKVTLTSDTIHTLTGTVIKKLFGRDRIIIAPIVGGSSINTATEDTTFIDLGYSNGSSPEFKVDGKQISITSSITIKNLLAILEHDYGITGSITDGKITLSSDTQHTLTGEAVNKLFGQDSITITPTAGDTTTHTAKVTTKMSELGVTDFKVNGSALSGITSSSTVNDVLAKLKSTYGLSEATISDGKITLKSNTSTTLSGNLINRLTGQDSVTISPETSTTTQTADTTTKLGDSGLGLTSFDLTIEPTGDAEPISISGLNGDSTIGDVFKKLAEKGITASMNNGVITLTSNTPCDLTGTIAKKLFGNDIVELECTDEIHNFDMTQVSGTKYQYVSRDLTSYSGAERVSEVSELVAGNKYHISSAEDLVALANFVKNGADTTGSIFMFDNDIDMSGVTGFEGIGTLENAFKGTVYGNGHVVENMTINTSSTHQGLFGYINQATIKDLGVVDANVTGGAYTGILVGQAVNSQISNAYTSGTVTSNGTWVGGLVGYLKDSTATNVYSTADVKGNENVGGLIGHSDGSIVEKAFATGKVTATESYVGGLIGIMENGGTVKNSYATGDVNGKVSVGGLVGVIAGHSITTTFDTVYSTSRVSGSNCVGGFVGFVDIATTTNIKNAVYNRSTGVDAIGGGSATGILGKDYEQMIQKSIMQNAGFTEDKGWVYTANSTPTFGNTTVTGGGKTYLDSSITSLSSGSTYYISTLEQLNNLATLVHNNGADTSGVNFVLDNDIDVSSFTNTIDCFKGTFYGNGHSLTGLKTALFSIVEGNAIVRDLALENMSENGYLAGTVMDNSTVDNVYSTGSTNNNAGLITTLEDNATLKNSYSTANITTSHGGVGGLVGVMYDNATIENCFVKNTINQNASHSKYNYAGGLVGVVNGGTIKSSYADCNVHAYGYAGMTTTAGSLIGKTSGNVTIENCYATGSIYANKKDFFIGQNDGSVTSSGNVACTGSSISGTPSGFSDGVTFVSNAELNSQARMEELGFTKDKGWVYYTGKAPMLQGKDTSSAGTTFQMSDTTTLDSICKNRENKTLSVTINGETHSKTFKGSDTVGDVANWLNGIDGVTANISNNKFNISGTSQDFRVDGELADVLFGNNKTTTKQTITENTDSNGLIVGGGQKKIDDNTTVGQLLGVTSGKYAITYIDDSGNLQSGKFSFDEKLSEVLKFLNDNGFQASIVNGVFTATKDGKIATNISGTIGEKLKGENGTVTNTSSGYKTGQLDASSSTKATATTKLADLGIASGSIFIKDNNNNTLGTIQIDNSMTIDDTAQLLANYGFTLGITDGKVTIEGNGTNRIADGTSNLVSQMKLNNWIETKDKLKTDSTVAQMGFGKGSTLGLVLDNKTYNLTFDANATLQDIIDTLGTYGVTASVDSDGKFTATASGNLVLTNELGAYLTKNSAEGYVKEADGYKSKDPLEFKGDKVKLDYDSKVGDILGTGKDGVLRLTLNKDTVVDLTYKADDTMADIIADLKGYGITATIDDGVLKATSNEKTFRFSGEIGKIISGDTPQYDDISTGYVSKDLSYETTNKTNMNNTLKEMGVSSGQIHVLSNDGKIVSTLDIDNSYTVAQVKSLLQPFGMTLSVDENGKFTVASAEGYKLSDSTSNMVSKMGLNNWTTATEKLTGATTLAQMGFKDGADLNLFLDGIVMNVLSFDANQTVDDIIFGLAAYGIDASVNADGQFTATSKSHTFIMSGGLGSYLTKGTGGYVNSDTAYESYKPLVESKDYVETASKGLDYNKLMTETSTLESLGFAQGGTVRVMLDGKTPYTLQFLATDKVQDVIYALSAYGINAEVKDGRFVAESVNNTFTLTGNLGSYLVQGGAYQNEITGYESNPLTYETTEKLTNDTKLSDLGITRGDINVIKDGKVTDTIHISDNTTIGQLFSAIKPYGMTGEIVTKANGDTSIRISADSDIKLADGTSNVVSGLGLQEVRKGDFEGTKKYWDDDATSGLITEDTLLSTLDRNGFIAQGSLIFNTGEGDDAVQHIINISANETVGSLLKKFNDSGIKATLDDGVIKLTGGLDKLEFTGGTSGLVETIGLDIHNIDKYASSTSALTYEGETYYSASNFANANTKLDIVNATDGNMSIFVDGIKCNIEVKSSDSFADLFKKIKDKVKARTGLDIQAGFKTKDGSISANPNDADNTGIIGLEIEKGHELVVGASNDTTNFATIANFNKTDYNAVTGSRALYRVNVNSLITESGLYRDGDITEGTFKIGDAEFTIDSTTTLASLINQINKNDKAYANAYWDTLAGTLVIESTVTGASLINIEAGTSNFTDIMGFTKTKDGVSALVTDSQTLGQNAVVRINGTTVTSATNVITSDISKIKGLTINLKNVSAGETVTISVEQDKEAIYSAVSDTLDAYNSMMEALGKELADKNSLGGESILKLMRNNLKRLMTSSLTGAYVFKNLASVGISTGEASDKISTNVTSLLIDKDKFMDALNTDSDAVQDLLVGTKANPGIFLQANNIVESSINTEGYFSNMANTLSKSISNIEKKISKNNLAIENYRTKLETKFHNMELTISGLQSAYANILK